MYLITHLAITLLLIGAVTLVQYVLHRLGDPKLLDRVPIRYIFDLMDLGLLLEFAVFATLDSIVILRDLS